MVSSKKWVSWVLLVYGFPSLPFFMYRVFLLSLTCSRNSNNSLDFHKTLSKQFITNTQISSLLTRTNYPMLNIEHWIILDNYGPNFVNKHFSRQVCLAIPWYRHSSCACLWRTFTLLFKIKIYSSYNNHRCNIWVIQLSIAMFYLTDWDFPETQPHSSLSYSHHAQTHERRTNIQLELEIKHIH